MQTGQIINTMEPAAVTRFTMPIAAEWDDESGEHRTASQAVAFPDIFLTMPAEVVDQLMADVLIAAFRYTNGVS
jgi:hypothetical protein